MCVSVFFSSRFDGALLTIYTQHSHSIRQPPEETRANIPATQSSAHESGIHQPPARQGCVAQRPHALTGQHKCAANLASEVADRAPIVPIGTQTTHRHILFAVRVCCSRCCCCCHCGCTCTGTSIIGSSTRRACLPRPRKISNTIHTTRIPPSPICWLQADVHNWPQTTTNTLLIILTQRITAVSDKRADIFTAQH